MRIAAALAAIFLMLAGAVAGSYALSLNVAHNSNERLCHTFEYFIPKPPPPVDTPLKQREETQYQKLVIFERRLGC